MPIVSGNEPPPTRNTRGSLIGWVFPLLFFGPMIYNFVRSATRNVVTDQQLLIVAGGVIGLAAMVVIARRIGQNRSSSTGSLPNSYTPPPNLVPPSRTQVSQYRAPAPKQYVPPPPRFEPIITGKVFLVGVVLAALLGGLGLLLASS